MPLNRPADLAALNGLSHLDDPLRRQLYEYVVESDGPVSREQAAAAATGRPGDSDRSARPGRRGG